MAALLLAGCADQQVTVAKAHHRTHVSPPAVEPPAWPADSFDQAKADAALNAARQARLQGDPAAARLAAETALAAWPVTIDAWEELILDCRALADSQCQQYATFFHAKLLELSGLPMRAAALGFETMAENPEGTKIDNTIYDRRTLDMAERLWVFCHQKDPVRDKGGEPTQESFDEAYPYAPALAVIGVGAGLLSGIKAVANK